MEEQQLENLRLKQLHGRLGEIVYELTHVQLDRVRPVRTWTPALNAYVCANQVCICIDLAGVDKDQLQVRAEPHRLLITGRREPPEPGGAETKPLQVLALEIDSGPFAREVELAVEINPEKVTAEQRNGLLWIFLPLRAAA